MSRGSSLKFQSPASLGGLFGRTQGTETHWQSCWSWATQQAARLGCKLRGWGCGLGALQAVGPQHSAPSLLGGTATGDGFKVTAEGWACPCLQQGYEGPWIREVQQPMLTPDCRYSCLAGQKSKKCSQTHPSASCTTLNYCSQLHYLGKKSQVKCCLQPVSYKAEPVPQSGRLQCMKAISKKMQPTPEIWRKVLIWCMLETASCVLSLPTHTGTQPEHTEVSSFVQRLTENPHSQTGIEHSVDPF